MNNFWKFLNTPLVVVIIALSIWPILTVLSSGIAVKLGIKQISEAVTAEVVKPFQEMGTEQDEKLRIEADAIKKITISNVRFAPTSWKGKAKIIGTITNNSTKTVKGIHLTASLYENNELVNVNDEWLARLKLLSPKTSADFNFTTDIAEGENTDNLNVSVNIADLSILE
jgi:hypothetical protein